MKSHAGAVRGFHHLSSAWYGRSALVHRGCFDEVMVGMYHPSGGTSGEFAVRWHNVGSSLTPRLEVFDGAWGALQQFRDLLDAMAELDDKRTSPSAFCDLLRSLGVKDLTERYRPA